MKITIDIETIGSDDPEIRESIAANIKPPGNYKKAESIETWLTEEKPALVDEAVARTGLDGATGQIICIGYAFDDEPAAATCTNNERALLIDFFDKIETRRKMPKNHMRAPLFIGHNIAGFDLKFILKRCVINGIRPPFCIPFKAKPWDDVIFDTMAQWDALNRISLDNLCRTLGIASSKGDMDGSKVWDAYRANERQRIADYCCRDVEAARAIYQRMTFSEEPFPMSVAA